MGAGRSVLYYGRVTPLAEAIDRIEGVNASQLAEAARRLLADSRTTLTLR